MKLFTRYPTLLAWSTLALLKFAALPAGFHEWR